MEELLTIPPDPLYYLSFPLIPKGGRVILGAPAKHYKSMLALNLAYDLAEGDPLFGLHNEDGTPMWPVKQPVSILYVEKEIGVYRLRSRLEVLHNIRHGEHALMNFHLVPKGTEEKEITLENELGLHNLGEVIEQCQPDILVLDPLRKFHTADEDSSTEMVKIFRGLDNLQKEHRNLTTIIVHHTSKRNKDRDQRDPESLRGSSIIFDDADSLIMVTRPNILKKEIVQLNFTLRSAADPHPILLTFDQDTFTFKKK